MIRLLILIILLAAALTAAVYLFVRWQSTPRRRLLRQYRRMQQLVLEGVDDSQREHVDQLLEDCEGHLRSLMRARERLDVLSEMADAASEFAGIDEAFDQKKLEEEIQEEVAYFVSEMGHIASEVDHDWRQSVERLEAFADELEQQREIFAQLPDMPDR